ncbi:hypothetical protein ACHAWF_002162 [Thalassiosira exigua]
MLLSLNDSASSDSSLRRISGGKATIQSSGEEDLRSAFSETDFKFGIVASARHSRLNGDRFVKPAMDSSSSDVWPRSPSARNVSSSSSKLSLSSASEPSSSTSPRSRPPQ